MGIIVSLLDCHIHSRENLSIDISRFPYEKTCSHDFDDAALHSGASIPAFSRLCSSHFTRFTPHEFEEPALVISRRYSLHFDALFPVISSAARNLEPPRKISQSQGSFEMTRRRMAPHFPSSLGLRNDKRCPVLAVIAILGSTHELDDETLI